MLHIRYGKPLMVAAFLLMLGGCATSGEKPYASVGEKNFHIHSVVDHTDDLRAYLYVYDVDASCKRNYLGYIDLPQDTQRLDYGLPLDKHLVVEAEFVMVGGDGVVRDDSDFDLHTAAGRQFYVDIHFKNRIYKVGMAERRGRGWIPVNSPAPGACGSKP
jgi:hypothetical protein